MAGIKYKAGPVPLNPEDVPRYLEQEMAALADAFEQLVTDTVCLEELYAAPPTDEGRIAFADGTTWNPGAGQGIYAYYGGAWVKL